LNDTIVEHKSPVSITFVIFKESFVILAIIPDLPSVTVFELVFELTLIDGAITSPDLPSDTLDVFLHTVLIDTNLSNEVRVIGRGPKLDMIVVNLLKAFVDDVLELNGA
jgi:hypothetical protein